MVAHRARARAGSQAWQPVCRLGDLTVGRGVSALVHGQGVAIFRTGAEEVLAIGNHDPFLRTSSLARGIVGVRDGALFVGSPSHGHAFDLRTGCCLDEPHAHVPTYAVKVLEGVVLVGPRTCP